MDVEQLQLDAAERPLQLASTDVLLKAETERYQCRTCHKSRCLYCPQCFTWHDTLPHSLIPRVKLPLPVVIIKHPGELITKSTAIHAKLLAPDDVDIRDWEDPNCTSDIVNDNSSSGLQDYLLFPSASSLPVERVRGRMRRLIVIDGTWTQARKIARETPALARLPAVHLNTYATLFWRYQKGMPRHYLATIEAISFFFREYNGISSDRIEHETGDAADNLLWLFVYNLDRVQRHYADHPPTEKISRHQLQHLCKNVARNVELQGEKLP